MYGVQCCAGEVDVVCYFYIVYNREGGSQVSGGCIGIFIFFLLKVRCCAGETGVSCAVRGECAVKVMLSRVVVFYLILQLRGKRGK